MVSYFKGVSRFLLSSEECVACCGLGFEIVEEGSQSDAGEKEEDERKDGGK